MAARLPSTVFVLGLASFFTDLSSEMIYPLLPVFLSTVLGATAFQLGLIEGIAEATASLFKVFSGVWTDRARKRKPLIVLGYAFSGFFRPLIGMAQSWTVVLGLRFFDRMGKGLRTSPRDALIADVTPSSRRGAAYGLHRSMDHAGAVMGPLAATGLLLIPGFGLREVFLAAAVPALITLGVLFWGIKEESTPITSSQTLPPESQPTLFQDWKKMGPEFRIFLISVIVFTLGNSADAFLIMKLAESGVGAGAIAALWSGHNIIKMLGTYFGGQISDRMGHRRMIFSGWIWFTGVYLSFAFVTSHAILILVFLLYGVYFGLVEPAERALVASLVRQPQLRGTAFGFFHFAVGIGLLPASLLFGLVWENWGSSSAFLMGSFFSLFACLLLFFVPKSPKTHRATADT